jgi:hypothetical protein
MIIDIMDQLITEILKAYKLSHSQIPPLDSIRGEASLILDDFKKSGYKEEFLLESYISARIHGSSNVPTIRSIVTAYLNTVKPRLDDLARKSPALTYNGSKHSCNYCPVVSIRLLGSIPDQTEWEVLMASKAPTQKEIECVRNGAGSMIHFWNTKSNSPYKGML